MGGFWRAGVESILSPQHREEIKILDDSTKKRLESILTEYDQKIEQDKATAEMEQQQRLRFVTGFKTAVSDFIRPALSEICVLLKQHGHECEISDGTRQLLQGTPPSPSVSVEILVLKVLPSDIRASIPGQDAASTLTFIGNPVTKRTETELYVAAKSPTRAGRTFPSTFFDRVNKIDGEGVASIIEGFLEEVFKAEDAD